MHIVINGQILLSDVFKFTGPWVYTSQFVNALAKVDRVNKYTIYLSDIYAKKPIEGFEELTNNNPNWTGKVIKKKGAWTQIGIASELFIDKPDIYFTAVHTLPVLRPVKTKVVSMIHGLEYKFSPDSKDAVKNKLQVLPLWYSAIASHKIIVPSLATKQAILDKGWTNENKITVISEGLNTDFYKRLQDEINKVKQKYNISNPYLIFVSTIQPRKNIPDLIKAFAQITKEYPKLKLVLVGQKGWHYEESFEAPKNYGIEDKVMFLGRVPAQDLPALMSGAQAYVNVSLEEGFGLPVLEAMACEVPVLASDIPAFRELGEGIMEIVNPQSTEEIARAIKKLLTEAQNERIQKAKEKAKSYNWQETAKKTLEVFEKSID